MKNKLKKILAFITAVLAFYAIWKIVAIFIALGGVIISGDKNIDIYEAIGNIIGAILGVYVGQKIYKLYPRWKLVSGILIISIILGIIPSLIVTTLQDAREKAMKNNPSNVLTTDVTLPVSILSTLDGQTGLGMYEDKYPATTTVKNASNFSNQISAYGASYEVWIGPNGWTGKGQEGVDGGTNVDLYPTNGGSPKYGPHIDYYVEPACIGCMLGEASPYFPNALKEYNAQYNSDGTNPVTIPEGLQVTPISPTLVKYTLPGIGGISIQGVAFYGTSTSGDPFYTSAQFALPQEQSDLSNFLLQNFINQFNLK